jgi:[ribosomal protein S18]-alanine N-acetyltransferase
VFGDPVTYQSTLRVQPCRNEDLLELEAVLQQSPEAANWSTNTLAEALARHPSYLLVAWQAQQIAGFISGRRVVDEAEILNLAVKPDFRRKGIGKALVRELLQLVAREDVARVFLEVRSSNTSAIAFYQYQNFRQVGKRPAYYQNPTEAALLFALLMNPPPPLP